MELGNEMRPHDIAAGHPVDTDVVRRTPTGWRVEGGPDGVRVERTDAAPDVSLDVSFLGAALLGRRPLLGPLRAGLITEHTPGAVARLDTALFRPDAAFCGTVF